MTYWALILTIVSVTEQGMNVTTSMAPKEYETREQCENAGQVLIDLAAGAVPAWYQCALIEKQEGLTG